MSLILKIHGYYYLPASEPAAAVRGQGEGKKLFLDISDVLPPLSPLKCGGGKRRGGKRYSTGPLDNIDAIIEDIF